MQSLKTGPLSKFSIIPMIQSCLRSFVLLLIQAICLQSVFAQPSNVRFSHLTTVNGLSQSTVKCILKDHFGFMWFGTYDGLDKYDGYKFTGYKHRPKDSTSIGSSDVLALFEDHEGNLWIGTNEGGLSLYDRTSDRFINFKANESDPEGLSNKGVTAIYEDRQNNLWVGTYWGLNLFDRRTKKFKRYLSGTLPTSLSNATVNTIMEDSRGNLWIGTDGGLNLLDRKHQTFSVFKNIPGNQASLLNDRIKDLAEDKKGRLWIATDQGLSMMDKQYHFLNFVHDPKKPGSLDGISISSLAFDADNMLWIGSGASLDMMDPEQFSIWHFRRDANDESSLNNSSVLSLYNDNTGILWVGTFAGGINKYDRNLSYFGLYRNNSADWRTLSFNVVSSFTESPDGDIWVGTDGGALNLFHKANGEFTRYNPDPADPKSLSTYSILRLCHGRKYNYLWIGTYGSGIDRFDPSTKTFTHIKAGNDPYHLTANDIFALLEDHNGNIWAGTNTAGINVIDPKTGIVRKFRYNPDAPDSLSSDIIRDLTEDKDGRIWIATYSGGICSYDPGTGKFRRYTTKSSGISSDNIQAVQAAANGMIWIGTMGAGLNRLDPKTGKVIIYTEEQGLSSNVINKIIEDAKGFVWISTNKGISRLDPVHHHFDNYSIYNGLQGTEFNNGSGFRASNGEIYFGGTNGFNIINPWAVTTNQQRPAVCFTGFQLFNKNVLPGANSPLQQNINLAKEITLSYKQSVFTIEFSALGYTAPESNQYAFKLEGFDKDWNYVGNQHSATYTNLDPGTYHFHVKSANNDGIWNEQGSVLTIIITPPYWETWWFRLLSIISFCTVVFLLYQSRTQTINRQKLLLEKQVRERTESLALMTHEERKARKAANDANIELERKNKELEQFAYVASHDLQEPLRTTSSFAQLLQQQYAGRLDDKADKYLSFIIDSSERMKVLIHDLLAYSRIGRTLELVSIDCNEVLQVVLSDLALAIQETKAVITCTSLPVLQGYSTEMKLLFQNLISNAIKFRKKDQAPLIHIACCKEDAYWHFTVQDNGIGLDPRHSERIFVIFQRLHTRNEYQGSGIGLSHCKKIVELHKGRIWVESTPVAGSTFHFTIYDPSGTI